MDNTRLAATAVFVKVVAAGSFRGAGQLLHMPKSTVSHRISELEAALGVRLLERTTRALRLTEAGRKYHAEVAAPLEALELAGRRVAELQEEPRGTLRLTAPVELGQAILGAVVTKYSRQYPQVVVHVELTDRRVDLIGEGFDLAVRAGPLADSTLMAKKLGRPVSVDLYASREYLKKNGAPKTPKELSRHDCLVMSGSQAPTLWRFSGKRAVLPVEIVPKISVNSYQLLTEYVAAGLGIAHLPILFASPYLKKKQITPVLEEYMRPPQSCFAIYPSATYLAPKVRNFIELLEECFAGPPWNAL